MYWDQFMIEALYYINTGVIIQTACENMSNFLLVCVRHGLYHVFGSMHVWGTSITTCESIYCYSGVFGLRPVGSEPTKFKCNYIYTKCNYIWANVITFAKLQPTKPEEGKCNYIQM